MTGWYLELVPDDLRHSFEKHKEAKREGNINLTEQDFLNIPDYIDSYDDILEFRTFKSGDKEVVLGKKINGYSVIVELLSGKRKSLHFKNMWGLDTQTYESRYGKSTASHPDRSSVSANDPTEVYHGTSSVDSIPQTAPDVNTETGKDMTAPASQPVDPLIADIRARGATGKSGAQTAVEGQEAASTAIDTDPATHMPEQMATIKEYQGAVDKGILSFVDRWRGLKDPNYRKRVRMDIAQVDQRTIRDIQVAIGVDVSDFTGHSLSGNALEHIDLRHGINGEADHSMADPNDIARMGYVLEHYDSVEALVDKNGRPVVSGDQYNADGSRAPLVRFSKRVDGTYYVVEAVPDSAAREFRVVSAYMEKTSGSTDRLLNVPQSDPQPTSKTLDGAYASATNFSIPQTAQDVNIETGKDMAAPASQPVDPLIADIRSRGAGQTATQPVDPLIADIRAKGPRQALPRPQHKAQQENILTQEGKPDTITSFDDDIQIGRSLGAAAKKIYVQLPDGRMSQLTEGSKITKVHTFAGKGTGTAIRDIDRLVRTYKAPSGKWKKVRGDGYVDISGSSAHAELHWYEAETVGRVEMKVKRWFK